MNGSRWYFIDTNIFLRVFIKENKKAFADCLKFLKLISDGEIPAYTSTIILMEINFVLSSFYKFPKNKVVEALKSIIELPHLKIIDDISPRYSLHLYQKNKVKFVDCLISSSSLIINGKAAIISYDRDFDSLKIKRLEPADF